ncbi:MAG TPA: vanadium-dependent haloperoxidase, partial [Ornithinibacter sp.]|nr:vanadium-dependent haloperoxidase [Ornithinibacter sp.]
TAPPGTSPGAAVAAAARDTLVATLSEIPAPFPQPCRDAGIASVTADYASALAVNPDGAAKTDGIAVGRQAAAAILAERAGDGSDTPLVVADYPQGTRPGQWSFTPDRPFAFAPGWGGVRTFGLTGAGQFGVAPPLPLTSARYAKDVNEVKALGGDGVGTPTRRTAAQTEIARFWVESSPLSWNRLARTLATSHRLDAWGQARLYGLLNVALADGYVASFATKYGDLFWRPVTAIREADRDGNRRTTADPGWTPLETTPPIPDHDSAHAVEGGAAAMVFRQFFGTDRYEFSHCSTTLPTGGCADTTPSLHHFSRFSEAAQENADSRVYIGFHFRRAVEVGNQHGEKIGRWVAQQLLRPAR